MKYRKLTALLSNALLLPRFGEGAEKNPFIDSQDILSKAVDFGLKIWTLDSQSSGCLHQFFAHPIRPLLFQSCTVYSL